MASSSLSGAAPALVFLVLLIFLVARRTIRQVQGAPFSVPRLFVFAGLYVLLFGALAFTTLYAAVGTWGENAYLLLGPYIALPVVAGVLAAPYVRRIVRFERRESGEWYYRLSWHVPVLYLALFTVRLVAEVAVFGAAGLVPSFPPPAPPSTGALEILVGVDLLFSVSLGLLLGRGVGVVWAHRDLPAEAHAPSPPPSPPLPSG